MKLILYSKPGCHLCEGLQEKLEQIQQLPVELEIRDITTNSQWFERYQFEIPVLHWIPEPSGDAVGQSTAANGIALPRLSPRASVQQVEQMLQKYLESGTK
jgi:hypothetical protein